MQRVSNQSKDQNTNKNPGSSNPFFKEFKSKNPNSQSSFEVVDDNVMVRDTSMPNRATCDIHTALLKDCFIRKGSSIKKLISQGANVNVRTLDEGWTPLMMSILGYSEKSAPINREENIIGELIKAGAQINAVCNKGRTALMYAAEQVDLNSILLFLQLGADINISCAENKGELQCEQSKKLKYAADIAVQAAYNDNRDTYLSHRLLITSLLLAKSSPLGDLEILNILLDRCEKNNFSSVKSNKSKTSDPGYIFCYAILNERVGNILTAAKYYNLYLEAYQSLSMNTAYFKTLTSLSFITIDSALKSHEVIANYCTEKVAALSEQVKSLSKEKISLENNKAKFFKDKRVEKHVVPKQKKKTSCCFG